jgi:hypothetical protein
VWPSDGSASTKGCPWQVFPPDGTEPPKASIRGSAVWSATSQVFTFPFFFFLNLELMSLGHAGNAISLKRVAGCYYSSCYDMGYPLSAELALFSFSFLTIYLFFTGV